MWRALVFLALLAIAAFAAVWLADRPGTVAVTWQGYEATLGLGTAVAALAVGLFVLATVWAVVRGALRLPERMTFASRARRRAQGFSAVSRGMIAVGSGDPAAARRHAGEAERLLGREPLALLLKAQAAQISGDRSGAETAFRRMADDPETRVLGLRGLFVEAQRRDDRVAARAYAAEAARLAPSVGWANEAVLETQCAEGDWSGALATVERRASLGHLDKGVARRDRAVLLTADALEREAGEPERAAEQALEAVRLAPDLVPAAALAGRLLSRRNELKKAARVIEAAWKAGPHPDLARVYLDLRPGDAARDRLARAETLARLSAWSPDARLAVAGAALDARDFPRARETLRPLLTERPTVRACLLAARIEAAEHGRESGGAREWLGRAARAPRDPLWIADGVASEHWAPVSPVTGRLDAFVWQAPPDVLAAPDALFEDAAADLEVPAALPRPVAPPEPPAAPIPLTPQPPAPAATAPADVPVKPVPAPRAVEGPVEPGRPGGPARAQSTGAPASPVIFPVGHAPDDPGPGGADGAAPDRTRSRLFG